MIASGPVRSWAKRVIVYALGALLGRRRFVLFSRALWMASRFDVPNDPTTNGELLLQSAVVKGLGTADTPVIFDVGANTGQWSMLLLRTLQRHHGTRVELHVFEPSPAAFHALQENLSSARPSIRLTANQLAVSSFSGYSDFSIVTPMSQVNALIALELSAVSETIKVSCVTLDDYCSRQGLLGVHFVKIDTEGNDFRVLQGAEGLLAHGRLDFLQFEYNHRWIAFRTYLKDVFDFIEPFPYAIGKLTPKGVEFYDRWHPDLERFIEGNYVVCKDVHKSKLPVVRWWNER